MTNTFKSMLLCPKSIFSTTLSEIAGKLKSPSRMKTTSKKMKTTLKNKNADNLNKKSKMKTTSKKEKIMTTLKKTKNKKNLIGCDIIVN